MGACAIPSSMKAKEKKKKKDFTFKSSVFKILDYKSSNGIYSIQYYYMWKKYTF
jgi:hypothetical protein